MPGVFTLHSPVYSSFRSSFHESNSPVQFINPLNVVTIIYMVTLNVKLPVIAATIDKFMRFPREATKLNEF